MKALHLNLLSSALFVRWFCLHSVRNKCSVIFALLLLVRNKFCNELKFLIVLFSFFALN
jgi:hypothetical protein